MERMKIFVLINIILMNGIDSKLHFHIFHSFRPISTMALCQITYVFIFPFSSIFFTIQIHFDIFFIALFAFGSLFSYIASFHLASQTYTQFSFSFIYVQHLSYDLQQLPKNKVYKNCERLNFLIIEMCGAYMTSFICLSKANYQLFFSCCSFTDIASKKFYYLFY